MHSGPGYFEIQADDRARAVRFYSEVFGWSFSEVKGLPVEYWQIQTATSFGGPAGAAGQEARFRAGHKRLCLLDGGRRLRCYGRKDSRLGRDCRAPEISHPRQMLARIFRRHRRKYLRHLSGRRKRRIAGRALYVESADEPPVHSRAFSPAPCKCRWRLGNRAVNLVRMWLAHRYSVDRISSPAIRNSTPGKIGTNRPTIPNTRKAQPQARAIHLFFGAFSGHLPSGP